MCERLKQSVLKTDVPGRVPGVRIPLPPPLSKSPHQRPIQSLGNLVHSDKYIPTVRACSFEALANNRRKVSFQGKMLYRAFTSKVGTARARGTLALIRQHTSRFPLNFAYSRIHQRLLTPDLIRIAATMPTALTSWCGKPENASLPSLSNRGCQCIE